MRTSAGEHGLAQRNGTGMFPREVVQKPPHQRWQRLLPSKRSFGFFAMDRFPLLPLEEGRLNDMPLRENFIEQVLAYGKTPCLCKSPFA
jgi:hypothetical protein